VRAELFHADRRTDEWTGGGTDGQTDTRRLTVVYRSIPNTPKNWSTIPLYSSKPILIHISMFTVDIYFQTGYQSRLWPIHCMNTRSVLKLRCTLSYLLLWFIRHCNVKALFYRSLYGKKKQISFKRRINIITSLFYPRHDVQSVVCSEHSELFSTVCKFGTFWIVQHSLQVRNILNCSA